MIILLYLHERYLIDLFSKVLVYLTIEGASRSCFGVQLKRQSRTREKSRCKRVPLAWCIAMADLERQCDSSWESDVGSHVAKAGTVHTHFGEIQKVLR